jgi:hypothetical protein
LGCFWAFLGVFGFYKPKSEKAKATATWRKATARTAKATVTRQKATAKK